MTALSTTSQLSDSINPQNSPFRPQDLGFFEPDNGALSSTTHTEGKTTCHDVFGFTARVRAKTEGISSGICSPASVAIKLDACLKGKAECWYTNELSSVSRAGLTTNLEFWCSEFEKRFRQSPSTALEKLENKRYKIQDVRMRKEPEDYVQNMISLAKHAGTALSTFSLLLTAYQHMDAELRITIPRPTQQTSLTDFMKTIGEAKDNWFDIYRPIQTSSGVNRGAIRPNYNFRNNFRPANSRQQYSRDSQITNPAGLKQITTRSGTIKIQTKIKQITHSHEANRSPDKNFLGKPQVQVNYEQRSFALGRTYPPRQRVYQSQTIESHDISNNAKEHEFYEANDYDEGFFQGLEEVDKSSVYSDEENEQLYLQNINLVSEKKQILNFPISPQFFLT